MKCTSLSSSLCLLHNPYFPEHLPTVQKPRGLPRPGWPPPHSVKLNRKIILYEDCSCTVTSGRSRGQTATRAGDVWGSLGDQLAERLGIHLTGKGGAEGRGRRVSQCEEKNYSKSPSALAFPQRPSRAGGARAGDKRFPPSIRQWPWSSGCAVKGRKPQS